MFTHLAILTVTKDQSKPPLHESLRAEYVMIQSKIDHIGEFKFRVRGWSLTLQTAIIAAVASGKIQDLGSRTLYIGVGVATFVIIFLFHLLEQEKEFLTNALGKRAMKLERALDGLTVTRTASDYDDGDDFVESALRQIESTPRIGPTMRIAVQKGFWETVLKMFRPRIYFFYFIQYALTVAAVVTACMLSGASAGQSPVASVENFGFVGLRTPLVGYPVVSSHR